MKNINRFKIISFILVSAYLLSACGGAISQSTVSDKAQNVQSSSADHTVDNSNSGNDNGNNTNDSMGNSNDNQNDNSNSGNDNSNVNGNDNNVEDGNEVVGVVEAITTSSITVNGVVYNIADFTEFNDVIGVGDQVKIHVILNADGTFTVREIEKSDSMGEDNNNNGNSNDANVNDDHGSDANSNDDNGNDANSNDDNGNDDGGNENDNGGNSNDG